MRYTTTLAFVFAMFVPSTAMSAIMAFTDLASFTAAANASGAVDQGVIGFDTFAANSILTSVGDVTFSEANGEDLVIYNTFGATYTVSPLNYVGDTSGFGEQLSDQETVNISFDPGAERSAVGLFVQYDPSNLTNQGLLQITAGGAAAQVNLVDGIDFTPLDLFDHEAAFFIGLVETTGANVFSTASLTEAGVDTISYTFDNFVSYRTVAATVPEPNSLAGLLLLGACGMMRVRRRGSCDDPLEM